MSKMYYDDEYTVPTSILQSIQDYVLGYYIEHYDGINPNDLNCKRDLEAEAEDRAIEKGYDPDEEWVSRDLQNWVLDSVYDYYREIYGSNKS